MIGDLVLVDSFLVNLTDPFRLILCSILDILMALTGEPITEPSSATF